MRFISLPFLPIHSAAVKQKQGQRRWRWQHQRQQMTLTIRGCMSSSSHAAPPSIVYICYQSTTDGGRFGLCEPAREQTLLFNNYEYFFFAFYVFCFSPACNSIKKKQQKNKENECCTHSFDSVGRRERTNERAILVICICLKWTWTWNWTIFPSHIFLFFCFRFKCFHKANHLTISIDNHQSACFLHR